MLFLQKSAVSETLGVIANVPRPRRDPRVFVVVRRSSTAARLPRGHSLSRRENAAALVRSAFSMKTIRSLAHFHSV